MRQDFKGYVLVDSRNRIVPGSLILRHRPPSNRHNGRWHEIDPYLCCNPPANAPITVALPTLTVPLPNYHINLTSGGVSTGNVNTGTTTGAALVTYLTTNYAGAGTFTLSGTNVIFQPSFAGSSLTIVAGA